MLIYKSKTNSFKINKNYNYFIKIECNTINLTIKFIQFIQFQFIKIH
jgi:hypothetical protein